MLDIKNVFLNPLISRSTSLTNLWGSTRTWDNINAFAIHKVHMVFKNFKELLMVLRGLKVEGTSCFFKVLLILFVVPWMKGRWTLELQSMGYFLILGPLLAFWKALIPYCLLYPLLIKNSRRWYFSLERWSSSEILRALVANMLRTPIFWPGKWCELAWRNYSIWVLFW